ncbi:MAG: 30S ribosome-binding factor RbfA [Schaalia hyovaginalis]|uniref:30S ribosome-binding factor RbfA n=1 Tax=Schaalia hyovaginalis TaxID=29316 RepID=UPI001F2499B9|nr:30S ribosome-binding factor RbfA [Schaalia hyovaginalis]MCF2710840.1 30S ribosome-binding factor RbfA [Schaalia hyovaginalis]MDD7553220.1 30S ribosome-binding factor RbfA [Schaalia hyovaginalis]MDY3093812.1 30S ribosome-binding factor RbfA [Schaalia hyovaginalis]MDY5600291.1 30S ribosome-binding factor RbfA [Schaalia hyovaginalis]
MADESRRRKVQDRIQQTVASMLGRRIKDPRLGFVTITDVRVTGDLQHASIFYTVLGDDEDRKATARAFESAKGIIRSEIGKALGIRLTPSIEFLLDALPESAAAIEGALAVAKARDEEIARLAEGAQYAGEEDPYRHEGDELEDAPAEYESEYESEYEPEDGTEDGAAVDEGDEKTDAHEGGDR